MRTNSVWVEVLINTIKELKIWKPQLSHARNLRYWVQTIAVKDRYSSQSISQRCEYHSNHNYSKLKIRNMLQFQHPKQTTPECKALHTHIITHTKVHKQILKTQQVSKARFYTSNCQVVGNGVTQMQTPQGLNYTRATSISREIIDKFILISVMGFWGFGVLGFCWFLWIFWFFS